MIIPMIVMPEWTTSVDFSTPPDAFELDELETRRIAIELLEMALDLGGIADPTPVCDGMSALLAISQGRWLDAALSGAGILPYVGDLAKAGKFPRYMRTFDSVSALMTRSRRAAEALRPALEKLQVAFEWLPARGSVYLAALKQRLRGSLPLSGRLKRRMAKPDVSKQFVFPDPVERGGFVYRTAHGRLGVPGKVKVHNQASVTHQPINVEFPGDDAGHLLGARFGAPDISKNLAPQNYRVNRGKFNHTIEKHWSNLLTEGIGVEATVVVKLRRGGDRPISWFARWTEITREGRRIPRESNVYFMNPHTPKGRKRQEILPTHKDQSDNVLDFIAPFPDLNRRHVEGTP